MDEMKNAVAFIAQLIEIANERFVSDAKVEIMGSRAQKNNNISAYLRSFDFKEIIFI